MSESASAEWLTWLYGQEPLGLLWIGGQQDGFKGRTFTSITEAVQYAEKFHHGGVYHRLTTMRRVDEGRGAAADSAYLPGFAMDLDLKGPGHKALNYPETDEDLRTLLLKAGLPEPSAWVHSGGGRYPFWKLREPADLTLPGALERAALFSSRLHKHVIGWAGAMDWKVDNTSDLARVYRLPGTLNRKNEPHVLCTVMTTDGPLYSLEELEQSLEEAGDPVDPYAEASTDSPFMTATQAMHVAGTQRTERRVFTLEAALSFVRKPLDELSAARDGEINNKLLAAALTLAHFGPEFWTREQADKQLHAALSATVYDGATWVAGETIERAYRDMSTRGGAEYWQASLLQPSLDEPHPETRGRLRKAMLKRSEVHALPDPVPLIEDVLYRNSVVVLAGKFGTYKSFVAVSWAASLATGKAWFGHAVPQRVPVIYAAAEGAYGIRKRLDAWEAAYGPIPDDLYLIPISVRLNRPEDVRELEELITETGAAALVFDTLHTSTPGVDENDSGEMGAVLDVLRGLQERHQICSILPHHTGHAGERARGSSSVEDDADISFVIRLDGEDRGPAAVRTLVHRKTKDDALLEPVQLKLALVEGTGSGYVCAASGDAFDAASGTTPAVEDWELKWAEAQRHILRVLVDQGGSIGLTKSEVRQVVADRWYGGIRGRDRGLRDSTFKTAWTRTLELLAPGDGEPVVINPRGEKWAVDPEALKAHSARMRAEETAK